MNAVTNTRGNLRSRNMSVKSYDMKIVETETDRAIHSTLLSPKLRFTFQRDGSHEFTDRDWLNIIRKGSNKTRFQYCQNSRIKLLYIRAIQGHTGGEMISPEMPGQFLILHNCFTQLERVCTPSRMFFQFDIHMNAWSHRRRARRS